LQQHRLPRHHNEENAKTFILGLQTYNAVVVDPEKIGFIKGSILAINFSKQTGMLLLGTNKVTIASGQRVVAKPTVEENGMYRMLVAYQDAENKPIACFDR
jgi:hypothetical protein